MKQRNPKTKNAKIGIMPPPLYVVTGLWHGKKRETISLPCSRLKAVELRDWTRRVFGNFSIYQDIQIREARI